METRLPVINFVSATTVLCSDNSAIINYINETRTLNSFYLENMESNNLYTIPYLSKELNLLGYPTLPYGIRRKSKISNEEKPELMKTDSDFSDYATDDPDVEIIFSSREMIETLVIVCDRLVKDMKITCFDNDSNSDECDRIKFEKCKLQKKFDSLKAELERNMNMLSSENKKSKELVDKVNELNGKVKALEKEKLKIIKQSKLNEEIIKHKSKIIEKDLLELQKILYDKLNAVDIKYLPWNLQIYNSKYPDLKKLWSEVKYSSTTNKEMALKKAVCIFQENNEVLMAENSTLKKLLFAMLEEIHNLAECVYSKMNLSIKKIHTKDLAFIFMSEGDLHLERYKEYMQKIFGIIFNIFNCIEKMSFYVGDNLFVCLTDVMDEIKSI